MKRPILIAVTISALILICTLILLTDKRNVENAEVFEKQIEELHKNQFTIGK
jgi:signal transduction histidine kinase